MHPANTWLTGSWRRESPCTSRSALYSLTRNTWRSVNCLSVQHDDSACCEQTPRHPLRRTKDSLGLDGGNGTAKKEISRTSNFLGSTPYQDCTINSQEFDPHDNEDDAESDKKRSPHGTSQLTEQRGCSILTQLACGSNIACCNLPLSDRMPSQFGPSPKMPTTLGSAHA